MTIESTKQFEDFYKNTSIKREKMHDFAIGPHVRYERIASTLKQLPLQVHECLSKIIDHDRKDLEPHRAQASLILNRTSLNLEATKAYLQLASGTERSDALLGGLGSQVDNLKQCINRFSESISQSPDKVGEALDKLDKATHTLDYVKKPAIMEHIGDQQDEANTDSTSSEERGDSTSEQQSAEGIKTDVNSGQERQTSIAKECLDKMKSRNDLKKEIRANAALILQRASFNLEVFDKCSQLIRRTTRKNIQPSIQAEVDTLNCCFKELPKKISESPDKILAALNELDDASKPLDEIRNHMKEIISKSPFAGQGASTSEQLSVIPEECLDKITDRSDLKDHWDTATLILTRTGANLEIFNKYSKNSKNDYVLNMKDVSAKLKKLETCTENLSQNISESPGEVKKALIKLEKANKEANKLLPITDAIPDNSNTARQQSTVDAQRQERMQEIESFLYNWDNINPEDRARILTNVRNNYRMGNIGDTDADFVNEINNMKIEYQEYQRQERMQEIESFLYNWDNSDPMVKVHTMRELNIRRGDSGDAERVQDFRREIENMRQEYREYQRNQRRN